jgi:putative DNA primase/helicase
MTLTDAIAATGMTPPRRVVEGRWLRFPGIGKGRSNRSGWCRVITPTLAIFGDWSSGLSTVWRDEAHLDDERAQRALRDAQERERCFAREQRAKQATVAVQAREMIDRATIAAHPYLARKGFPALQALTLDGKLLVPMMDFERYPSLISAQLIDEQGQKKFLPGGRAKGGVHRLGVSHKKARRVVLCEGYATGLSIEAALRMLTGHHCVIVCFSASNLEHVSGLLPISVDALVAADNDAPNKVTGEKAGEAAAMRTGRRWVMPDEIGDDWNDVHVKHGIRAVMEALR